MKWSVAWIALLLSTLTGFVVLELYSWASGNPSLPTLSVILVTLIPPRALAWLTVIACAVLLWHWRVVYHDIHGFVLFKVMVKTIHETVKKLRGRKVKGA